MKWAVVYIAALVTANILVAVFGPKVSVINAFLLIGLDLSLRDKLHDLWRCDRLIAKMGGLIVVAGAISYLMNQAAGPIAIASCVAFCASMAADAVFYEILRHRNKTVQINGSNIAGAAVDSVVFPTLAFGGLMWEIVALQFFAKTIGGFVWAKVLKK